MKKRKDPVILILSLISVIVLSLTVGFAAFNTSLDITGSGAVIVPLSDIRIASVRTSSSTSSALSYYNIHTDDNNTEDDKSIILSR